MLGDKECSIVDYDHRLRSGGQVTTLAGGSEACVWGSGRTRQPAHALTPRARAVRPNGRRSGPSKPRPEGARCAPPSLTANSWPRACRGGAAGAIECVLSRRQGVVC